MYVCMKSLNNHIKIFTFYNFMHIIMYNYVAVITYVYIN